MAKLGRLITLSAIAAATGAGVYYYLNKSAEVEKTVDAEDADAQASQAESVADFFKEKRDAIMNSREYVSLSKNLGETKNALVKTVTEAAELIKERAAEAKDGVGVVADDVKDMAEDFEFDEFEEAAEEVVEEAKEAVEETVEEVAEAVEETVEE